MKLTRRKFFAGLAVAPLVAVAVSKALPVLADNGSLILARWTKDRMLPDVLMPQATWRQLYQGVMPFEISRKPLLYWRNHGKD